MPLTASLTDRDKTSVPEINVSGVENPEAQEPDDSRPVHKPEQQQKPEKPEKTRPARPWPSVTAFLLTLVGWICLPYNEFAALAGATAGLILSLVALRQRRGAWRNLALISLVAAAVLLLVLVLFWGGIIIALRML